MVNAGKFILARFKVTIEYDGTNLIGWQKNASGPSVQSLIENAIHQFSGEETVVYSAGRTDAGVHALAMVAHFDLEREWESNTVLRAVNFYLKNKPVVITACEIVDDEFHARFSCIRRNYRYMIFNRRTPTVLDQNRTWWVARDLNIDAMRAAAEQLIGNHDFTSFRASECQAKSPVKTLDKIEITTQPYFDGQYIIIDVSARSFLHHMVRNIVGTLVEIGLGKPYDIPTVLNAHDRSAAGPTAPASGLVFLTAEY